MNATQYASQEQPDSLPYALLKDRRNWGSIGRGVSKGLIATGLAALLNTAVFAGNVANARIAGRNDDFVGSAKRLFLTGWASPNTKEYLEMYGLSHLYTTAAAIGTASAGYALGKKSKNRF